jgi:hypothetical protein
MQLFLANRNFSGLIQAIDILLYSIMMFFQIFYKIINL